MVLILPPDEEFRWSLPSSPASWMDRDQVMLVWAFDQAQAPPCPTLATVAELSAAELDALAEEATVDAYRRWAP
jgi:hypothetical protein